MTNRLPVLIISLLLTGFAASCSGEEASGEAASRPEGDTITTSSRNLPTAEPAAPPCSVEGELLPGNWRQVNQSRLFLALIADSTTYEEPYGPSHRVLMLYDTVSCQPVDRQVLPVNRAPDYAYQIADIIYNNNSRLVAIRGFDVIYCYNPADRRLLPPLTPRFKAGRHAVDAQSGMIRRVEVWENFLVGYAQDFGAFAFDLRNPTNPEPVLPFAEYEIPEDGYASLFLLPSGNRYQILLPEYAPSINQFEVNPLLERPRPVSTNVPEGALDNRFLVLRLLEEDRPALAIDMLERRRVELPAGLRTAAATKILEWLRQNS